MPPFFDFSRDLVPELNFQQVSNKNSVVYTAACTMEGKAVFMGPSTRGGIVFDEDLTNYTFDSPSSSINGVAALGGNLVCVNISGLVYHSPDGGLTWNSVFNFGSAGKLASNGIDLIYGFAGPSAFKSVDGINWVSANADFPAVTNWSVTNMTAKYVNGQFYFQGLNGSTTNVLYRVDSSGNVNASLTFIAGSPTTFNALLEFRGVNVPTGAIQSRWFSTTTDVVDQYNIIDVNPVVAPEIVSSRNGIVPSFGGNKPSTPTNYILNYEWANGRLYLGRSYGIEYFEDGIFKPVTRDIAGTPLTVVPMALAGNRLMFFSSVNTAFLIELNRN